MSFLCDAGTDTGTILAFVPKCKTSIKVKYVAIVNHKFHCGDWISCMKSTYIVKNFLYSTVSNTLWRVFLRQHQQNDLFQIFYQSRVCSMFIVIHVKDNFNFSVIFLKIGPYFRGDISGTVWATEMVQYSTELSWCQQYFVFSGPFCIPCSLVANREIRCVSILPWEVS